MKYMLMMNTMKVGATEGFASMSADEINAHIQFMHELNAGLAEAGELVDAQGLSWPDQARIIRADDGNGNPEIFDGPFPESKEFLAGFWILDVESDERVVEIATHISTAPGADGKPMNIPVEVRPIMSAPTTDV